MEGERKTFHDINKPKGSTENSGRKSLDWIEKWTQPRDYITETIGEAHIRTRNTNSKTKTKIMATSMRVSIIALNINGLNSTYKRQGLRIKDKGLRNEILLLLSTRNSFYLKRQTPPQIKDGKSIPSKQD